MGAGTDTLPILGVRAADVAQHAIVVGDPARAGEVASKLTDAHEVGRSREYVTFTGSHREVPVTVCSHGVGAAGAAVCFEELARAGVTTIVRAGTCGGLQPEVVDGHLVVGTAAVRDDGLTDRLVAPAWPAVADPALTLALAHEAAATGLQAHVGVVHTAANFYPDTLSDEQGWQYYGRAGALAIEMEYAALLVVASQHRIRAGGIFAVDGNLLAHDADMSDYDPHREVVATAKDAMLDTALTALTAAAAVS